MILPIGVHPYVRTDSFFCQLLNFQLTSYTCLVQFSSPCSPALGFLQVCRGRFFSGAETRTPLQKQGSLQESFFFFPFWPFDLHKVVLNFMVYSIIFYSQFPKLILGSFAVLFIGNWCVCNFDYAHSIFICFYYLNFL